ncbi:MAG TPA: peptide deformylase [Proteobacteria bacterium]|nr:peptide deformylase [Pseudomonadota bacterium]
MLKKIVIYPDSVLKKASEEIADIDGAVVGLARDMAETMYAAPGIGLAAPQVGVLKRIVVLDVPLDEDRTSGLIKLANPVLVESEGEVDWEEGCLSLPGLYENVRRRAKVLVKGIDIETGREREIEADGLLAIALQHEIDHLDGVLFIDRLSPLKRKLALKKYQKLLEERAKEL